MAAREPGEQSLSPAEVYEKFFVPALFHQWGTTVSDIATIAPKQRVLDVACGTGVLAIAAAERVGNGGEVIGLDPNEDMLAVARRKCSRVEWKNGRAENLPFADASFDRVVSQFGLMFFEDRVAGLREMLRVLRPGGRLAIVVCDALDHSPGYAVLAELLHRLFGASIAEAFRAPFVLGDPEILHSLCRQAGIEQANIARRDGTVRFSSIASLVSTERACVWTLGGLLDAMQFNRLLHAAEESLRPFAADDAAVNFDMPALAILAAKP
jgi:SAM-dependent methyltransferase